MRPMSKIHMYLFLGLCVYYSIGYSDPGRDFQYVAYIIRTGATLVSHCSAKTANW